MRGGGVVGAVATVGSLMGLGASGLLLVGAGSMMGAASIILIPAVLLGVYWCTIGSFLRFRKRANAAGEAAAEAVWDDYMVTRMDLLYPPGWTGEIWEPK